MPKFLCKCGYTIPAGEIPTPNQWNMISDVEYDTLGDLIDGSELYLKMKIALKCPICERL